MVFQERLSRIAPPQKSPNSRRGSPGSQNPPFDAVVAAESTLLPGEPQGDPADRFLIATARTHGIALATRDEHILKYARSGLLHIVRM